MKPHWSSIDHHVVYIDLDRFKNINDTHGHRVGDEVLTVVASRLRDCVREGDFVARLGGDEFAVILSTETSTSEVLRRMRFSVTEQPISVDGHLVQIGASFGIARPQADPLKTLEAADRAMYLDKIHRRAKRAS
jgi:diguanylate cyclase (GGDEF)-like protein